MTAVPKFLEKTAKRLFGSDPERYEKFIANLVEPAGSAPAVIWMRERPETLPFDILEPASWQPAFVDRLPADVRPGSLPLHDEGALYSLDLSSVFMGAALQHLTALNAAPPAALLDLCASPGGKSVLAWRLLQPKLHLANEVIGKRLGQLISNLERCRLTPAFVASMDSARFAELCAGAFPVTLVDAPCSGQSLLVRGKNEFGAFHPSLINMNSNRQKRILANGARTVAPGGYLAYMTCTFDREENEGVAEWLLKRFPEFAPVAPKCLAAQQSHLADFPCYRLWPWEGFGAGGFTVLFQREGSGEPAPFDFNTLRGLRAIGSSRA